MHTSFLICILINFTLHRFLMHFTFSVQLKTFKKSIYLPFLAVELVLLLFRFLLLVLLFFSFSISIIFRYDLNAYLISAFLFAKIKCTFLNSLAQFSQFAFLHNTASFKWKTKSAFKNVKTQNTCFQQMERR